MPNPSEHAPYVRPDVRAFLDFINAQTGPKTHEVTAAEARRMYHALRALADDPAPELAVVRDVAIPAPHGTIPARLFDPRADRTPGPAIVFFHGGGWTIGDLDTHAAACAEIALALDLPLVAVDYRLAPEHVWPAQPDDCETAARWIAGSPAALGRAITGIVLAGDSAGGGLAISTTLALRDDPAAVPVLAQWPIYPAADIATRYPSQEKFGTGYFLSSESMDYFHRAYSADVRDWRGSPIVGDQRGLPRTFIVTAALDPLLDQGRAYAAACVQAGVQTTYRELAGTIHGWLGLRKVIPSGRGDLAGCLVILKSIIAEAEAERVMEQAA